MRFAICHYSFHRRWAAENWTADRLAQEVKALGVEGIDFHVRYVGSVETAAKTITNAVANHGLTLAGLSMSNNFNAEDAAEFKSQIDTVKMWMPVAAEIEAPASRIFGGHIPFEQRANPETMAAGMKRVKDGIAEILPLAEKYGIVFALENHGGLPCSAEEQIEVIEHFNSPHLKANIDFGNYMSCGQEGHEGTAKAAKYAVYTHVKDFKKVPDDSRPWGWNVEPCAVGDGAVNVPECIKAIEAVNYDGFITLEYEGVEGEEIGVPRSVEYMKSIM